MSQRILIAGGGTGGHVYPAIATIEALKEIKAFEFLYVGGKNGLEEKTIPKLGIPFQSIWVSGFQRYFTVRNFLFPIKLMVSLLQSWKILKEFKPLIAIGTGGYVSGPVIYVASKMGIPVLIQEQDVYPGVTTRLLAKYAHKICLAYEGAQIYFEEFVTKTIVTGNPVRVKLIQDSKQELKKKIGFNQQDKIILVFGGSQGARSINQAMEKLLPNLIEKHRIQILWQTGEKEFQSVKRFEKELSKRIKLVPYIDDMSSAYTMADVIISRAGAITLAELAIVQKPTILIPYPFAAGKHQEHNAKFIEEAGAALMVIEKTGWEDELEEAIEKLLTDHKAQQQMINRWNRLACPAAARNIASEVLELINTN
jgi:UDP-N-acetylglucosamine--N-acetylmuramyl-(pentapeptide) pyrophosphoryl-undecaprenol N-acetylglucosamine transferase